MKEHPDYKYRPRRKPKTLVKSPVPSSNNNNNNNSSKDSPNSPNGQIKPSYSPQLPSPVGIPPGIFPSYHFAYDLHQKAFWNLYAPHLLSSVVPPYTVPPHTSIPLTYLKPPKTSPPPSPLSNAQQTNVI